MFCKSCGINLGNRQPRFCPACGGEHPTQIVRPTAPAVAAIAGRGRRLLRFALLSAGLLAAGVGIYWVLSSTTSPVNVNQSFTLDYPSDAKNLDVFVEGDNFDTVLQGGPYYLGVESGQQQPIVAAFRQLKGAKVAEAAKLTRGVFEKEELLLEDVRQLQDALFEFWNELQTSNPDLRRPGGDLATLLLTDRVKLEGLVALYKGLPGEGNDMVKARNAYRRSMLTVELSGAQTRALARLTAVALPLVSTYEKSSTPQLKDALRQFEARLERMTEAGERLAEIQSRIALLASVLRQINTGEHYMGLASLEYARRLTPTIQANLTLIATSGRVSGDDLDFMQENLKYQGRVFSGLEKSLRAVPAGNLLSPSELDKIRLSQEFSLILTAHAAGDSAWERSIQALSMVAVDARKKVSSKLAGGWQSIKTNYQDAKGAVGFGMDGVNTAVKSGFDYAIGKWEGNSDKDIRDTVVENFAKMERNLVTGESGADVFESAEDYFNAIEEGGGDFAGAGVRTVLGDGNASWLAGHIGKITVNMFTGFGKGIAKIANTRSTDGEVAEGVLDVGLSFIGGSKALGKASQIFAGGKSGVKTLGKKGLNFLDRVAKNADLGKLRDVSASLLSKKKLTPGAIQKLISNAAKIEGDEALKQSLLAVNEAVNKEFIDLIAKAGATLKSNATAGVKQSYKEFTQEVFKESLQGYKEALVKVLGNGFSEYVDNLVANKADDMFKVMVKEYVDRELIESGKGNGAKQEASAEGNSLEGVWAGQMKFKELWLPGITGYPLIFVVYNVGDEAIPRYRALILDVTDFEERNSYVSIFPMEAGQSSDSQLPVMFSGFRNGSFSFHREHVDEYGEKQVFELSAARLKTAVTSPDYPEAISLENQERAYAAHLRKNEESILRLGKQPSAGSLAALHAIHSGNLDMIKDVRAFYAKSPAFQRAAEKWLTDRSWSAKTTIEADRRSFSSLLTQQ